MSPKSEKSSPAQPVSDCEVRDPRIRRTRQLLQGALWKLMKAKGFDEISVQDIADTATVNRATFYDHYTDKYGLLEAAVGASFHALLQERKVSYDATCASGASALILATCEFLVKTQENETECRRQSAFEPLIDAAVIAAIRRVLLAGDGAEERTLAATAASWAIYGSVKDLLHRPQRVSVEAIVPVVLRLVLPILQGFSSAAQKLQ